MTLFTNHDHVRSNNNASGRDFYDYNHNSGPITPAPLTAAMRRQIVRERIEVALVMMLVFGMTVWLVAR